MDGGEKAAAKSKRQRKDNVVRKRDSVNTGMCLVDWRLLFDCVRSCQEKK
ncbi:unnamed protein product [Ectocarpus sp. CCAP 1310/34]|nr:unnamed protein product [Ectocarpus sp. CCAP 1310/34]